MSPGKKLIFLLFAVVVLIAVFVAVNFGKQIYPEVEKFIRGLLD